METASAQVQPSSSFKLARRLFLAGIAATYALAFGSLLVQVQGLFGAQGIVPLAERMQILRERVPGLERLQFLSVFWFGAGDAWLSLVCWLGLALALLVLVGVLPRLALALCWLLYLSFVSVGSPFLDFQWDVLLLEAGLLAVVWAPDGVRPFGRGEREPSRLGRWLVYWLLLRLMLLSGAVKLASWDPSWRDGTALDFHFWTQPLPHALSHYAHWSPEGLKRFCVLLMFAIELGLPWLLLVPWQRRRLRQIVAAGVVFLMAMISLTGNYGFFNFLTVVLCIPLVDDAAWARAWRMVLRRRRTNESEASVTSAAPLWRTFTLAGFAALTLLLTSARACERLDWIDSLPGPLAEVEALAAPLASFNAYGLFAAMTKERLEILVDGSEDGVSWKSYEFRYKPGDVTRAPVYAFLHMPRLDWQLWFAALDFRRSEYPSWVREFLVRVLAGSPSVLALLGENPFPDGPPHFVRARVALYQFSTPAERKDGVWWQHGDARPYLPTLERKP